MINLENYRRYLETQELKDFNTRLIHQYIQETYRDVILDPKDQLARESIRKWMLR